MFLKIISTKIATATQSLFSPLAEKVSNPPIGDTHSQIWVLPQKAIKEWRPHFYQSFYEQIEPMPTTGLTLEKSGCLTALSETQFNRLIFQEKCINTTTLILPTLGVLGWATDIATTLFSNRVSDEKTMVGNIAKAWAEGESIQDSSIFLVFSVFFSSSIMFAGLLGGRLIQAIPRTKVITPPQSRMIEITTSISQAELIGTPEQPGLLIQTAKGVLLIHHWNLLEEGAKSLIETVVSNGGFSFPIKEGHPPLFIPYHGQIITGYGQLVEFSDVARCSGRIKLLEIHTLMPGNLSNTVKERNPKTDNYSSLIVPTRNQLNTNPFQLIIGRNKEIELLKKTVNTWIQNWKAYQESENHKDEPLPSSLGLLIYDKYGDDFGQFGQGKTRLGLALQQYFINLANQEDIQFPGVEMVQDNGGIHTILTHQTESSLRQSLYMATHISWVVLTATLVLMSAVLAKTSSYDEASSDSVQRLGIFNGKCVLASTGIGILGFAILRHLHSLYSDTSPHIFTKPGQIRCVTLASAPTTEDIVGQYTEKAAPQRRYTPSKSGNFLASNHSVFIESGAIDRSSSDSHSERDNKRKLERSLPAILVGNKINLAGSGPEFPVSTLFIVTSNNGIKKIKQPLADACLVHIPLESIIPFNEKQDGLIVLIQLKQVNEKTFGLPWTDQALKSFIKNIQFKERLPKEKALIVRHYFQELIPEASSIARQRNHSMVEVCDFNLAWSKLIAAYQTYFDKMLAQTAQAPTFPNLA